MNEKNTENRSEAFNRFNDALLIPNVERAISSLQHITSNEEVDLAQVALINTKDNLPFEVAFTLMSAIADQKGTLSKKFEELASCDPLTGLPNRRAFEAYLKGALAGIKEHKQGQLAVVFIDMDYLKLLNDGHGYEYGDTGLRLTGEALRDYLRSGDIVARYGGDEFCAIINNRTNKLDLQEMPRRLEEAVAQQYMIINGNKMYLGASAGLHIVTPDNVSNIQDIIELASNAMHARKAERIQLGLRPERGEAPKKPASAPSPDKS